MSDREILLWARWVRHLVYGYNSEYGARASKPRLAPLDYAVHRKDMGLGRCYANPGNNGHEILGELAERLFRVPYVEYSPALWRVPRDVVLTPGRGLEPFSSRLSRMLFWSRSRPILVPGLWNT